VKTAAAADNRRAVAAAQRQRVYSASSSNESAQDLPQKRRTLSSGLSQYQHAPFGGRLSRAGAGVVAGAALIAAAIGSTDALLSGTLSCIVSKVTPLPATRQ
jgi:hypothetical protein